MLMTAGKIDAFLRCKFPLSGSPLSGLLAGFLFLILPVSPVSASYDADAPVAASPAGAEKTYYAPPVFTFELGTSSAPDRGTFNSDFKMDFPKDAPMKAASGEPSFLLQKGTYGGNGYGVQAEMGDIQISETRNTAGKISGRGGKFTLLSGSSGNAAKLQTFAAAGPAGRGPDRMLVGATGELSLMRERARLKTIFLSNRESLDKEGRRPDKGAKRGEVLGVLAVLDPFMGRLSAEAEVDYSVFDRNTADDASAVRDSARRLKLGGVMGTSRYSALYEKTGPQYRPLADDGPARDSEGVAVGLETAFELHALEVKLSRYNDNTQNSDISPRLYRYEGLVDYTFKGLKGLPLSLRYKKTFIDSTREPLGSLPTDVEEDAVFGKADCLLGRWDLGLRGGLSQRTDKLKDQRESSTTSVGFKPKYAAGPVTVIPDFSMKTTRNHVEESRTDLYAVDLGVKGTLLSALDYEVKGGYNRETGSTGTDKETVGAKLKALYPLARFFKWSRNPSLGIRGEYREVDNRAQDRRESDFSLLISLDGGTFL